MVDEVSGALIATGGGGKLAGKNGSSTWCAKDSGSVGVTEVDSSLCELVNVGGDGSWFLSKASDPVVHIIHGKQQNIRLFLCEIGKRKHGQKADRKD